MKNQSLEGWLRVGAGLLINLCMGTIYSWSVFRTPMEELFSLTAVQSGLPYMIFLAMFAFSMPLGGWVIGKIGPRLTTVIGAVLLGSAWVIAGISGSFTVIVAAYGALGGVGVGLAYGAPLAVAGKWFPRRKGLAMGIALVGFGLSPFITAPLAEYLILSQGVLSSFWILGAAFFVIIAVLGQFLVYPKTDAQNSSHQHSQQEDVPPGEMLRRPSFYVLWSLYVIGTLSGLMVIGITSPAAQEIAGLTGPAAAILVSVMAVFNGLGRPLFGSITDKFGARNSIALAAILVAAASGLMLIIPEGSPVLFSLAFAVFWLLLGGWLAIAPAATTVLFGSKYYSQNYGIMYTAYGVGAILGTLISGEIRSAFGSYRLAFIPTLGLALAALVVVLIFMKKEPQKG